MPARPRGRIRERVPRPSSSPEVVFEGRGYWRGKISALEIGVDEEGIITQVGRNVRGGRRVDLGERLMLPSALDLHVHFRDPGPPGSPESFASGTKSAALGGISAVVDMPNTVPPTTTPERVIDKIARIQAHAQIDVIPFAALRPDTNVARLARVASGFKLYLAPTTGDLGVDTGTDVGELLREAAATGLPVHVHAEDPRKFNPRDQPRETDAWDRSRPEIAEISALEKLRDHPAGMRLHVAHVTSAEAARLARELGASSEATPHHLLLSTSLFGNSFQKVNPPLRAESTRKALWETFRDGLVPMVASDHAPHSLSLKEAPFPEAPSGMPGVETLFPLLLETVRRGDLELSRLIHAACRNPALHLDLPRGRLEKGCEANFLAVDFRVRRKIRAKDLSTLCGWTPFEGREAVFPLEHYLLGKRIVDDGEFVGGVRGRSLRVAPLLPKKSPHLPGSPPVRAP